MKYVLSFCLLVLLSGCCKTPLGSCDCEPPDPFLLSETKEWLRVYDQVDYFIFEDHLGNQDTLHIRRENGTKFCGGLECGNNDCEVETRFLQSSLDSNLVFSTSAQSVDEVKINDRSERFIKLSFIFDLTSEIIILENPNTLINLEANLQWNNQSTFAFELICNDGENCNDYQMTRMLISREFGLLEFTSADGSKWRRIN
ncbi:MAG: hypothetical protein AAFU64_15120 [Bacteroidota bacterium]